MKAKFEHCYSKSLTLALGIPQDNPLRRNSRVERMAGKPQTYALCLCVMGQSMWKSERPQKGKEVLLTALW